MIRVSKSHIDFGGQMQSAAVRRGRTKEDGFKTCVDSDKPYDGPCLGVEKERYMKLMFLLQDIRWGTV